MQPFVLVATGLKREAALLASPRVKAVVSGGDEKALQARLRAAGAGTAAVVSVGIGGGLAGALEVGDWVVADRVVNGDQVWPIRPDVSRRLCGALAALRLRAEVGPIASGGVIVASPADKAALYASTGALAVDMESHVAAAFALERGAPFAALRVISDAADHALPPAVMVSMRSDGGLDLPAVLRSLVSSPRQLPALVRTGRRAETAFGKLKLLGRHDLLGRLGVGDPDLGQLAVDMV